MGKWALLPLDCDTWHTEEGSNYFKSTFGLYKGLLIINTEDRNQHAYMPESFFKAFYKYIEETTAKDFKALERKLKKFYSEKERAKKEIPKINPKNLTKISNTELIKVYKKNRDWAHKITVYDQFAWLGEEYWTPIMERILSEKLGIAKNSEEYNKVLFTLTKPEEISTTLEEKRAVLKEAIEIKKGKKTPEKAGKKLSASFGWMPVFTYGTPWDASWYATHVREIAVKALRDLEKEYEELKNYTRVRNKNIKAVVKKYNIDKKDLQVFVDFGLALDARNEAEYVVSLCGFHLLPVYEEIVQRLKISVTELRMLYEREVVELLQGKSVFKEIFPQRKGVTGYGFTESMDKRFFFSSEEAEKLFRFVESNVTFLQGNNEYKGTCASPGKATGIARIIPSPKDNHRVKEGEILITSATTVDYLPAMKKAAAIITEVGGLTCHAAVVSREFGIPCVVALKNAMKNIKDGDMIEVDADKGIVRRV